MEGGGLTAKLGSLLHQTTKKLGEVVSLEYGKPLKKEDRKEGDYPVFGSNGIVGFHDEFIVQGPCIIVGRKGSAGEVTFTEKSAFPIDTAFFVSLRDENTNLKYIYYILQKLPLKTLNIQAAVPGLNRNDAYDLEIPLPPLPKQKRIVAILDEAFEGIDKVVANTKKNLANARELFDSYLNNIFTQKGDGWVSKAISETIVPSGTIDPRKKPDEPFRYVDVSSISNKTFKIIETSKISGKNAPSRARRLIKTGDILFATIRPTLRRIAIVPRELDGEVCSTGYFVFRTRLEVDSKFFFYQLFTDEFMGAMEILQSGASYPAVNETQVKQQKISFPPLSEQNHIVAKLDVLRVETQRLEAIYQQKLTALTELKQSFLQRAFTGELTAEDKTTKIEAVA